MVTSFCIYCDTGMDIAVVVFEKLSGVLKLRSYSYVKFLLCIPD